MEFNLEKLKQGLPNFYKKFGEDFVVQIGQVIDDSDDMVSLKSNILSLFLSKNTKYQQELAIALDRNRFADDTKTHETKTSEPKPIQNEVIEVVARKIEDKKPQFKGDTNVEISTK